MITYTTLMGISAGMALLLVTALGYKLFYKRQPIASFEGWALSFGGLGAMLVFLAGHMTLTWPLVAPERFKNFMFGELNLALGVLLILAAIYLWRNGARLGEMLMGTPKQHEQAVQHMIAVARPVSWIVFALGLALTACAVGAFQYEVFATAPAQEPFFGTWSKDLMNASLSMLYVLPAIGCLLAPLAVHTQNRNVMAIVGVCWALTGAGWLAVGALVYYTHIAMDFNFRG